MTTSWRSWYASSSQYGSSDMQKPHVGLQIFTSHKSEPGPDCTSSGVSDTTVPPEAVRVVRLVMQRPHVRWHSVQIATPPKPSGVRRNTSEKLLLQSLRMSWHPTPAVGQPPSSHGHGPLSMHGASCTPAAVAA